MNTIINTNTAALQAQRRLNVSQMNLQTTMERLSVGVRVNSAQDDAAGLAISASLSAQMGGLRPAHSTTATTDEGIEATVQRMRGLAAHAMSISPEAEYRSSVAGRLEQNISNQGVDPNLQPATLRIRDVDEAKEIAGITVNQIHTQPGIAMLAQANQSYQSVLALLR